MIEFFGSFFDQRPLLGLLLMLMTLDIVTGFLAAIVTKVLSSSVSASGTAKKGLILCLVAMTSLLEPYVDGMPISRLTSFGFIIAEMLSIVENCGRAGINLPVQMTKTLEKLKDKDVS